MTSNKGAELDKILDGLLGEFHKHKCLTCHGADGGCINCRKTGYNQTPCKICDKDGISSRNRDEAKAQLTALINNKVKEARLDELEKLQALHTRTYRQTVTDNMGNVYVDDTHSYISKYETQERIAHLKLSSTNSEGGEDE